MLLSSRRVPSNLLNASFLILQFLYPIPCKVPAPPCAQVPIGDFWSSEDGHCWDDMNAHVWQAYFSVAMQQQPSGAERSGEGLSSRLVAVAKHRPVDHSTADADADADVADEELQLKATASSFRE